LRDNQGETASHLDCRAAVLGLTKSSTDYVTQKRGLPAGPSRTAPMNCLEPLPSDFADRGATNLDGHALAACYEALRCTKNHSPITECFLGANAKPNARRLNDLSEGSALSHC